MTTIKEARRRYTTNRGCNIEEWLCIACGVKNNGDNFHLKKSGRPESHCKVCQNKRTSSKVRGDRIEYRKSSRGLAQDLIATSRRRALKAGISFSISIDWLEKKLIVGACEITGISLVYGRGRNIFGPSLDQKIPGEGYTEENTQLVCWAYNAAKGFGTHEDVVKLAKAILGVTE